MNTATTQSMTTRAQAGVVHACAAPAFVKSKKQQLI